MKMGGGKVQIEIELNHYIRRDMCEVYLKSWTEKCVGNQNYILAYSPKLNRTLVAKRQMGAWMEVSLQDIVYDRLYQNERVGQLRELVSKLADNPDKAKEIANVMKEVLKCF